MMCKYPDKYCGDRYLKTSTGEWMCRLREWKKREKRCPYDETIMSKKYAISHNKKIYPFDLSKFSVEEKH